MILFEEYKKEAEEIALACWREGLTTPVKRKPSVWAREVRKIPAGTSPLSQGHDINYDHAIMPHCVEQMDAADDPSVNVIVIWEGIRDGKTGSVCLNILGRTVTDSPGNIYSVHPVKDDVDRFSVGDVDPMIECTPELKRLFVEKKSRDSGRTIAFMKFIGGWLRIVSAGSLTKFRGTSVKVVLLHDLDALDPEAVAKALGRATGFSDAIKVLESTCTYGPSLREDGTLEYNSNIQKYYEDGDKRKWFCKCKDCGHLQWLKYAQIKYPVGHREAAKYHCANCDYAHTEAQWREMVANGRWFPTAGLSEDEEFYIQKNWSHARAINPAVRSYWRNGFNSLLPKGKGYKTKLHEFVEQGEAAKKTADDFKTWKNEVAAELWNPDEDAEPAPDWKPIFDRREDYATDTAIVVPAGALVLTVAVDVHKNRLEVLWEAWGRHEETWDVAHVVLPGEVQDPAVWKELEQELQRKFQHELGGQIGLSFGLVDAGKWPDWVYHFLRTIANTGSPIRGKIRACRGSSVFPHPVIDPRYKSLAKNLKGHWVGPDAAKDLIYARLKLPPPQDEEPIPEGFRHYPQSFDRAFFEQLTIEQVRIQYVRGEELRRYDNKKNLRNETLDLSVYNLAAFRIRSAYPWEAIEKELTVVPSDGKHVEPQRPAKRQRKESKWLNWR